MNFIDFFHLCFLNSNISFTIYVINIHLSVHLPKVLLEGGMSQIFGIGPSNHFMSNIG